MGWSMIAITTFNLLISFGKLFISTMKNSCYFVKKASAKHEMNKEIKLRAIELAKKRQIKLEKEKRRREVEQL